MRSLKIAAIVALVFILTLTSVNAPGLYASALSTGAGQTFEGGHYSGIVKENNPSLGYITLYFQDGSGTNPDAFDKLVAVRNFTYGYEIMAIRDGATVLPDNIQPGDQVFIKLDEEGYITKLSAKSYYKPVYGTVHMRNGQGLVLKKEDGSYVSYPLNNTLPVFKNGRMLTISDIAPGDRIRVFVQTDDENIDVSFVEIEKITKPVNGVYKAYVEFYDQMRDALSVSGVQEFVNGSWENSASIGIQNFAFASDYKSRPFKRFSGTAYFATRTMTDGSNRIVMAAYRSMPNYGLAIKDNFLGLAGGSRIELENTSNEIATDQGTIIVKDGRLVDVSALNPLDPVRISAEKSALNDEFVANVLVSDSVTQNTSVVYRGRIKSLDPMKSITVESFAQLNGITWAFTNTPKTFDIDLAVSRMIGTDGIGNIRALDASIIGQSFYIVATGSKINLISTAPYADSPVSGRVKSLAVASAADPSGLVITNAMVYDTVNHQWNASVDITMNIPANAIVLKKGTIGTSSLIKTGDEIQAIRHSQSKDGIIVICK